MANQIVNISESSGVTSVDHDHVRVSLRAKDEVVWKSSRDFTVDFGKAEPFAGRHFQGNSGSDAHSGWALNGQVGNVYKYTVTVAGAKPLDPDTQVDP